MSKNCCGDKSRNKADKIQSFADRKDSCTKEEIFFGALRQFMAPRAQRILLTVKEAILRRMAERFDGVHNRPLSINDEAINRLAQVECTLLLDEFPTVSETVKAIKHNICYLVKLPDQMQYRQRSVKQAISQLQRN